MDVDPRTGPRDRRRLIPRDGGRRQTDPTNARMELERLAGIADLQARPKIAAVCRVALAYIDALEAEVTRVRGNPAKGGQNRMASLTPERRSAIAKRAAQRRWQRPDA